MNPSTMSPYQVIANVCVILAAIIYLLPLQNLLWEFAHKKNDSAGGAIAALIVLLPMWLLLWGALTCVTVSGGLDWLRLSRPALHTLTIAATLAMAIVSLLFMGMTPRSSMFERIAVCAPIYLFPLATMLLVMLSLNPRFTSGLAPQLFRFPWLIFASLSITVCIGFVGYQLVRTGGNQLMGVANQFRQVYPASEEILAQISTFDVQNDFTELLQRADANESNAVREAATARLRTHPDFIDVLAASLNSRGSDSALAFVYSATFSPGELAILAQPTRTAVERFTSDIPAPNYMSSERRKELLSWGRKTLPAIAKKFAGTGVDFAPTIAAFEEALVPVR
ncbi:MAG: hypothetical protein V4628_18365 [Pseudomonadota bacterium]